MLNGMNIEVELVGLIILAVGGVASYVRLKLNAENEKSRLDDLEQKQARDHQHLLNLQSEKEKALWDEIKSFRGTLYEIGQGLGRVEGKLDTLRRRE